MKSKIFKLFMCLAVLLGTAADAMAFGLPELTKDAENPVYYRIRNTRRVSKSTANYWTETNGLSTSVDDAVTVYFTGAITNGTAKVKIINASGDQLKQDMTWGTTGIDWYIQERVSDQGNKDAAGNKAYNGVVISSGLNADGTVVSKSSTSDFNGTNSGCWYVGSSDTKIKCYTPTFDGSIFTIEAVNPYPEMTTDDANPIYYRIYNMYTMQYLVANENKHTLTTDASEASLYYFKDDDGSTSPYSEYAKYVYIYSPKVPGKVVHSATAWKTTPERHWFLNAQTNSCYTGFIMSYDNISDCWKVGSSDTQVAYSGSDGKTYKGAIFNVERVEIAADAAITTITWNIVDDAENVLATYQKTGCIEGEEYTATFNIGGITLSGDVTATAGKTDQTIKLTYSVAANAPFQYSTSYATAKWYTMTVRGSKYPRYDAEGDVINNLTIQPAQPQKGDLFAFIGTPFGLQIINAEAGKAYALGSDNVANDVLLKKVALESGETFQFEKNGTTLTFAPTSNTVAHLNDNNNHLGYWAASASATDGGSNFKFEPVDDEYVTALFNGEVVFKYTETNADVTTFDLTQATNYDKATGTFTASGGWTFAEPKDLTAYKWLVITTTHNAADASRTITLTDANGKSYSGDTTNKDGEALSVGPRGKMWLDRWNNQICAAINMDILLKDGFALDKVSSLTFGSGSPVSAVFLTNYEEGKAITSTEGWGSCTGDYQRAYAHLPEGESKYGMIALKYAAAVSGAKLYTVEGFDADKGLYLKRHYGVMGAGVPYIYEADDHVGKDNSATGASNVNFFRVDANEVSGSWSDDKARDNGLIGVYDGGFGYGVSAISKSYLVNEDGIVLAPNSGLDDTGLNTFTKNTGFFDPSKCGTNVKTSTKILPVYGDVNLTAKVGKYGTFCAPFAVSIPEGVSAYTAAYNAETKEVDLTAVEGTTIAKNTPVILQNTTEAEISQTFAGPISLVDTAGEGLVGILRSGVKVPAGAYVLQTQSETQKFFKVMSEATGVQNRCYLSAPAASDAREIVLNFGDEATAISHIFNAEPQQQPIYDLSGRKVNKAQKGIYIVNGKKVLF